MTPQPATPATTTTPPAIPTATATATTPTAPRPAIDDTAAAAIFGTPPPEPTPHAPTRPARDIVTEFAKVSQTEKTDTRQPEPAAPDFQTQSAAKQNSDQANAAAAARRAALQMASTAPNHAQPPAILATFGDQTRAIMADPDTARKFTRTERDQIARIFTDRAAGLDWDEASENAKAPGYFIFWAAQRAPAIKNLMDAIDLHTRAANVATIEAAINRAAAGRKPRKGREKPDTRAAALYLSGNDPRYHAGRQDAAPVVNIQLNI